MSLIVDGVELQVRPHLFFWLAQGLDELPEARGEDLVLGGVPGRTLGTWVNDGRRLELRGWIEGYLLEIRSASELRAQVDVIKRLMDPSRRTPALIQHLAADGGYRTIRARPESVIPQGRSGATPATRVFSIALAALEPAWSGEGGIPMDAGYVLDGSNAMDAGVEIVIIPTSSSYVATVEIAGTARPSRVRMEFTGSISTPGARVLDLPEGVVGFSVAGTLGGAGVLVVDTFERLVERDGANARVDMTLLPANRGGEYISLAPGANELRIIGQPSEFRLRYTPAYL